MLPLGKRGSRLLVTLLTFLGAFVSQISFSLGYVGSNYEAPLHYREYALNASDLPCGSETQVHEGERFLFDSASAIIYESSQYASQSSNNPYNRYRRGLNLNMNAEKSQDNPNMPIRMQILNKDVHQLIQGRNHESGSGPVNNYGSGGHSGYGGESSIYGGGAGYGYPIKPIVCQWTFFADYDCTLEIHIIRFKPGDLNCYKQQFSVSDNHTEFTMCGQRKLYPGFRAEGASLYIKHWRLPYTYRHVFKGYVTCVGRAQRPTYTDASHQYYTPEVHANQEAGEVAASGGSVDSFKADEELTLEKVDRLEAEVKEALAESKKFEEVSQTNIQEGDSKFDENAENEEINEFQPDDENEGFQENNEEVNKDKEGKGHSEKSQKETKKGKGPRRRKNKAKQEKGKKAEEIVETENEDEFEVLLETHGESEDDVKNIDQAEENFETDTVNELAEEVDVLDNQDVDANVEEVEKEVANNVNDETQMEVEEEVANNDNIETQVEVEEVANNDNDETQMEVEEEVANYDNDEVNVEAEAEEAEVSAAEDVEMENRDTVSSNENEGETFDNQPMNEGRHHQENKNEHSSAPTGRTHGGIHGESPYPVPVSYYQPGSFRNVDGQYQYPYPVQSTPYNPSTNYPFIYVPTSSVNPLPYADSLLSSAGGGYYAVSPNSYIQQQQQIPYVMDSSLVSTHSLPPREGNPVTSEDIRYAGNVLPIAPSLIPSPLSNYNIYFPSSNSQHQVLVPGFQDVQQVGYDYQHGLPAPQIVQPTIPVAYSNQINYLYNQMQPGVSITASSSINLTPFQDQQHYDGQPAGLPPASFPVYHKDQQRTYPGSSQSDSAVPSPNNIQSSPAIIPQPSQSLGSIGAVYQYGNIPAPEVATDQSHFILDRAMEAPTPTYSYAVPSTGGPIFIPTSHAGANRFNQGNVTVHVSQYGNPLANPISAPSSSPINIGVPFSHQVNQMQAAVPVYHPEYQRPPTQEPNILYQQLNQPVTISPGAYVPPPPPVVSDGRHYLMTSTTNPSENYIVVCQLPYPNQCNPIYMIPLNDAQQQQQPPPVPTVHELSPPASPTLTYSSPPQSPPPPSSPGVYSG